MSNIIFKGDTKKNFGEYFPNIYIDRVVVRNDGTDAVFLDISYSLFFHVTDEFNKEDVLKILENVNFYFAMSNITSNSDQRLSKSQLISDLRAKSPAFSEDSTSDRTLFYPFSKEKILDNLSNDLFTNDVYDSQDRRVMIITTEETISYSTIERRKKHIYLYAFTSLYDLPAFQTLIDNKINSNKIYDLSISDISYEKIFSPNLNILDQQEIIFVDGLDSKYQEVPILGLNGSFYKTETITRESIITQVNSLINRFTSKLAGTPLSQSIDSIKYVLDQFGGSEKLLVELDRVRKSFPNKTNNNRLGNLYAAFSKLLITINSGFLSTELLAKQKMLTGKVIDRREEIRYDRAVIPAVEHDEFMPSDAFLMERTRLSKNETNDLSQNSGVFLIRYEAILKQKSKLSRLINIERLLEFPVPSLQVDFRRVLFAHLRSRYVVITKSETSSGDEITVNLRSYDVDSLDRAFSDAFIANPSSDVATTSDDAEGVSASISEEYHELGGTTPEIVSSYRFEDLDKYASFYELEQNENGGMVFDYKITAAYLDLTLRVAEYIQSMLKYHMAVFYQYSLTANEICSYNNIQNRFNDFFVQEITKRYNDVYKFYPWETCVFAYCLAQYVLTDRFENVEDLAKYSRNLIKTVSPAQGTLESISNLVDEITYFYNLYYGSGSDYNATKESLESEPANLILQKTFNVALIVNNPQRLELDASEDYKAYIISLFRVPDPIEIATGDTDGGQYLNNVDESSSGSAVQVTPIDTFSQSEYYTEIKDALRKYIEEQQVTIVPIDRRTNTATNSEGGTTTHVNHDYRDDIAVEYRLFTLNDLRNLPTRYVSIPNMQLNYWTSDRMPEGYGYDKVELQVAYAISTVLGEIFTDAVFARNAHLAQDGGMTTPFDHGEDRRRIYTENMRDEVLNRLKSELINVYELALQEESRSTRESASKPLSNSERNSLVSIIESEEADRQIHYIVDLVFKYYRDNYEYLAISANPNFIDHGSGNSFSMDLLDKSVSSINTNYPPQPELPQFVIDEFTIYVGYHGVTLDAVDDLDYDEELAET